MLRFMGSQRVGHDRSDLAAAAAAAAAQVALVVKNLPAVAGDTRDMGSILVLEDSLA